MGEVLDIPPDAGQVNGTGHDGFLSASFPLVSLGSLVLPPTSLLLSQLNEQKSLLDTGLEIRFLGYKTILDY